ncbi:MAG: hypothetical protein CVV50_05740 [Spirochaetae bacterium HGW-Spirochaetae-6]|nr:MAG: hypothetical protein CVV50_05740 [Spirochaetae bacterium HGW-Spirochaetae-6]
MAQEFQDIIKENLDKIRTLHLQTFENLTRNQGKIEIIIKEVLEHSIDEREAIEKITEAVDYAEKLQKSFSKDMRQNLENLINNFPDVQGEDIQDIRAELEKIYQEMEQGVLDFVETVKELYKV